jgi:hypothetical protein
MFVGESGSGKTVAEASFPKPMEFMDFDGRIRGLLGAPWVDRSQIKYEYYPPRSPNLITKLNGKLEGMMGAVSVGQPLPETFITDSITNQNYAFICQAIPITHAERKSGPGGKWIGPIAMAGPEDYGLEAQACYDYISFLKSLPIPNVIISAHVVPTYSKEDPDNPFSATIISGERLSIRDKISANIQTNFDHIFKFERTTVNEKEKFWVTFRGGIARTAYANLPGGKHDVTGKNFYEFMMEKLNPPGEKK